MASGLSSSSSASFRFGQAAAATAGNGTSKTLVLCFDETSNYFDYSNTNVVKLFEILDKSDTTKQICYYQPGIGTYTSPSIITPITAALAKTLDLAFAWYISAHITAGYEFLMSNYSPGDKICLFGFSRGAYTARALAGMLEKVGLIHPDNFEMVNFAYDLYKNWTPKNQKIVEQCRRFKQSFARPVTIEFMGVWDTVGSVGFLVDRHLPFANQQAAKYFRQACALDEHRVKFPINRYHQNAGDYESAQNDPEHASYPTAASTAPHQDTAGEGNDKRLPKVLEVWFAGAHADVGGGNALDSTRLQLSNIPLNWMIAQVLAVHPGIRFDPSLLNLATTAFSDALVSPPASKSNPSNGGGMVNQNIDPPIRDPLWNFKGYDGKFSISETFQTFFWQLLELLPLPQRYQDPVTNKWHKTWLPHFGKARVVPPRAYVHTSVLDKIALGNYKPRPDIPGDVHYVGTSESILNTPGISFK